MGSGFVLYALMDAVVDRYFPIIDALEAELEAIEAQIFTEARPRQHRAAVRTEAARHGAAHAVVPLLEAAGKLHGGRVPQVCMRRAGILPRRATIT